MNDLKFEKKKENVFDKMDKQVDDMFETIAKATRPEPVKAKEGTFEYLVETLDNGIEKLHHLKIDFIVDEIKILQNIMHKGFMDNINEMYYGTLTKNLHNNVTEISDFINRHEMNAEQSAKSLFDIMLKRDFYNSLR